MVTKFLKKVRLLLKKFNKINIKDGTSSIHHADVLLFCHDSNRGITLNNKAYSPLLDSVKDDLEEKGFTCFSIAHPWSNITGEKAYGNPIAMNLSYLVALIKTKLFSKIGIKSDIKLYKKIIRKCNPKAIITINCNDALCSAANSLEIFHMELLHGIGYSSMKWDWDQKEKDCLPQCILSLDSVSTNTFSALEKKGILIKEIPNPFLRRFQENSMGDLPKEWLLTKSKENFMKEILISFQWGFLESVDELDDFKGMLSNGLFCDELEEVIKLTRNTVFWRFRFHPIQYRQPKKYKKLFDFIEVFIRKHDNCDWKESTNLPLPSVLMHCSGHITMSSMASYEAAYLGVPTLALSSLLKDDGIHKELFSDLVKKGYLLKGSPDVVSILNWVNRVEKMPPLLENLSESNSLNVISDLIVLNARSN